MSDNMQRRDFLAGSLAAAGTALAMSSVSDAAAAEETPKLPQEYYEWRVYRCANADKQQHTSDFLRDVLLPALQRAGSSRVGVFSSLDNAEDHSLYVLIAYPTLDVLGGRIDSLEADEKYQKAGAAFFAADKKSAAYQRIESRLMKAFAGMPVIELPTSSKQGNDRIFELRIYEAPNEERGRRKVAMFNEGEIDIMRDVKLGPVFFGETLISNDVPNLTYMLSADSVEAHKEHWQGFRTHSNWQKMKGMARYKNTVSKITSIMLKPTDYSQI